MKNVIHIFGAAGSGTTSLAKIICEKNGFFHMDTDDYYWYKTDPPFTSKRPESDRVVLMKKDIEEHENVVISGSVVDWGDELIPYFTLAVRLNTDTDLRLKRIVERERNRYGDRVREGGDMYDALLSFLTWAASYDTESVEVRSRACHDLWQTKLSCPLLILDGSIGSEELYETIRKKAEIKAE